MHYDCVESIGVMCLYLVDQSMGTKEISPMTHTWDVNGPERKYNIV